MRAARPTERVCRILRSLTPGGSRIEACCHIRRREDFAMTTGTVKWFNTDKGYGFIEPDDGTSDAFVHISAVERAGLATLVDGQKISYELQPGRGGKSSAENLSLIE